MAKHLRLRISRAISTTLHSCRSKDPSILPEDPLPLFSTLGQSLYARCRRPSFSSRAARDAPPSENRDVDVPRSPEFKWQEEEKWHVVARIYENPKPRRKIYSSEGGDISLPPAPPPSSDERRTRRGRTNRKKINTQLRRSTSSGDSEWFSSDVAADEEEAERLVSSSLSFSTDSSAGSNLNPIRESQPLTSNPLQGRKIVRRRVSKRRPEAAEIPARQSMLKKLIPCTVEGKVRESYVVVKRSEDPYEDFLNSMMDMVQEKQMFDRAELEQLLQCFLSLNSRQYHGVIVEAFSEIWEAIFAPSRCSRKPVGPTSGRVPFRCPGSSLGLRF